MEKDLLYFIYLMLAISTIIICSYFSYTTTKKDYQKGKQNLIQAYIISPFTFIMFITDGEFSLNEIFLSFFIVVFLVSISISFMVAKFKDKL
jgi:hypothetical protein